MTFESSLYPMSSVSVRERAWRVLVRERAWRVLVRERAWRMTFESSNRATPRDRNVIEQVCARTYVCMHYICIRICAAGALTRTHVRICMYACMYVYVCSIMCMYASISAYMCARTSSHTDIRMHVRERAREKERDRERQRERVCVCVRA